MSEKAASPPPPTNQKCIEAPPDLQETPNLSTCDERPADKVPDEPPIIRLPCCPRPFKSIELKPLCPDKVEVVTSTERCKTIAARLQKEKIIALAAEGIHVGKEGPITLLQIATCSGLVYVFDILENRDLVHNGRLRMVFQDENVQKVMHDCSSVNAALEFQFATSLTNVFDTQVAHLIIERHKGRRLPAKLKLFDLALQYAGEPEKLCTYDWRTDSKSIWMSMVGNFWALRPLTSDMVEFAACDVIVLIPDVYRHQADYIEQFKLQKVFRQEVEKWLAIDIDMVVREKHGKMVSNEVISVLHAMDSKYDDRAAVFNILAPDEITALALSTYEDAAAVSERIRRLKTEYIIRELDELEVKIRTDIEGWQENSGNVLEYLRYYGQLPNAEISTKATDIFDKVVTSVLEHIEEKYHADTTTTNMLTLCERDSLLTLPYTDVAAGKFGEVQTTMFWRLMHEEIHGMINFLRFSPTQFQLTEAEYKKIVYFGQDSSGTVPEEIMTLACGLIHALRAYNASNGTYNIEERRKSVRF